MMSVQKEEAQLVPAAMRSKTTLLALGARKKILAMQRSIVIVAKEEEDNDKW
jgi:hypothetical protein